MCPSVCCRRTSCYLPSHPFCIPIECWYVVSIAVSYSPGPPIFGGVGDSASSKALTLASASLPQRCCLAVFTGSAGSCVFDASHQSMAVRWCSLLIPRWFLARSLSGELMPPSRLLVVDFGVPINPSGGSSQVNSHFLALRLLSEFMAVRSRLCVQSQVFPVGCRPRL